jgi:hypothetical protein
MTACVDEPRRLIFALYKARFDRLTPNASTASRPMLA